jgi:hypothetical protein
MGIDGIGKPPTPPTGVGGTSGAAGGVPSGETFRVGQSARSEAAANETVGAAPVASSELERLARGEISLNDYLDAQVGEATRHLTGKLSPEQLDFVKTSLRAQLETDPVLIELVRRATAKVGQSAP